MHTARMELHRPPLLEVHELAALCARVGYRGWALNVYLGVHEGVHLQIAAQVSDAFGPGLTTLDIHCRVPRVARRDPEHFLDWLLERIEVAENHETREFFKVDGRVYDSPHAPDADRDLGRSGPAPV